MIGALGRWLQGPGAPAAEAPPEGQVVARSVGSERVEAVRAEASPEALRLGAETPSAPVAWSAPAPPMELLHEVARIGDHLGWMERELSRRHASPEDAELAARVARARTLADLAGALLDLREQAVFEGRGSVRA